MSGSAKLEDVSDKGSSEHEEGDQEGSPKASSPGSSASVPLPTVLLDRKMEALVNEWNRNPDMLFTIHPVDGSFLVWHVKYLDEYIPGIFRQVQVAFSSRIPVAFPTGDANSLSKNIMVYACTFTEKDSSDAGQQKKKIKSIPHSASETDVLGSGTGHSVVPVISPAVMMVSKHIDGSLNQWAVTFADKSTFSSVLTVSHKFRYCGHRFHLNDLACHTVLPLLLTSSHHNALLTPESENEWDSEKVKQKLQPFKPQKGFSRKQLKNAATRTFHDPNAIYSELILWRVDHIGPLSCTGGVSELARINSLHTSAFSNVAWLPTLIPSHCLGTYCNSASACFVASDGKNLRLYQAVVDARKLLDELSDPEISKLVGEAFNIVSQQSTARPGCIIELDVITNQQNNAESSPDSSPGQSPLPRSSSTANLQSASKLILSSKLVYSQPLDLPNDVEVIRATPSAVTTCSDSKVRFWHCIVEIDPSYEDPEEGRTYRWDPWSLMNEEDDSNSAVCVPGRPVAVSCSYTGRLAVAFKQLKQSNGCISKEFSMHVSIFECESTGGSEWVLEQTIHLDDLANMGNALDPRVSVDSNLCVYSKSDLYLNKDHHLTPNIKHFVHLDWLSKEDGSHILTVGVGSSILMYGRISGIVNEQTSSKDGVAVITLPLGGSIKQGIKSKWILLRSVDLVSSVDGTPSLPVSLSWVRDGILVIGMDCEMHVYAQWKQDKKRCGETESDSPSSSENIAGQVDSRGFDTKARAMKHSVFDGPATAGDAFAAPTVLQDGGLFEAAHSLSPTLPQYHPTQLLELMDLGKVRRAKAILSHLVKCIAGEVAIVRDTAAGEGGARRHLSRTISVSGSTAKDTIIAGRDGVRDYTEIDSIPPLPLYALLSADLDTSYKIADESGKVRKGSESQRKISGDQYEDLFQVQAVTTDDFVSFATEKRESKSRVINLSQYGLTYFGPEHARVLSSHLMHSSLPGLTRLEQMFLVALADTVATTSTEVGGSREKSCTGGETIDECGLRYLLAMRLHTCLLTSLPPLYRLQLLHQGVSTCHFAWAFHSEAEDEMLNMIPAMQRGDPQWTELRAMGVGWWVRNINTLRRTIEKVAKTAFQRKNDPLDAALFYLAIKKKASLGAVFRSQHDDKMTQFFSHNFNEDRWRKAALKNAFSLLGKQRFEQAAAFFLLAGSLKDAIEVCLEKMEDIQLAMVVSRLYESDYETSPSYKGILNERETTVKQLQSPLPLPTTLPLLSASIAATKTVIANPVLHLSNHIHDIMYTILQMDSPPHPNIHDDKPFLPLSDSGALYDSDESLPSDDEDDDDAFLSDTQIMEHSDPNSYSWALLRLVLVKLALHNVKNFFPVAGLEFSELPVTSPLGNAVIKTLENWEQILLEKINKFDGPPPNYINTYPSDISAGGGPAILRHKAMLEPDNTPFKAKHYLAFPVKRLWHFLVKQDVLQDTFIRYIFTKKRKQSEVEADLGYPGGKAKIIHKESDIIMAFAVNKASNNEIVLASTHDVQEIDASALLAAQPYTWIGEEFDKESRSSDDLDHRSSHTNIAQASAPPFAPSQMPASPSMPWLGSGQTSTGANVCGVADGEGFLSLWQVNQTASNPKPYLSWQCHSKATSDFAFLTSSSLIATTGQSNDNRNVCLWDTLVSPNNSLVHAFPCHDSGATALQYAPKQQLIISGGRKGFICIFDIRQRQLLHTFQAHDSAVKALAMDSTEDYFITGSAEGNMKVWRLTGHGLIYSFTNEHAKQSIFRNIGAGVVKIETGPGNRIFTCGADGTLKMRVLPDRYNVPASIFDIL
ncbi:UNVERIFIED_CONTAM: hypothetical protein FKN15_038350 [Acipenser sinensis]